MANIHCKYIVQININKQELFKFSHSSGLEEKMQILELMKERMWVKDGNLSDNEGEYEKAIIAYDHALQIDPTDAEAWYDKGETLKKMGKIAEANECIETAVNLYCGK